MDCSPEDVCGYCSALSEGLTVLLNVNCRVVYSFKMANTFFPKEINCQVTVERHFHGFSSFDGEQLVKICQHHKLRKVAEVLSGLYGGHEPAPHHTNVSVLFRDFVELYLTFSLNISPLNLVS